MITRLYANNYRCLVAFETTFDSFSVICGPNGSGKSSVFDVIEVVRKLAAADVTVEQALHYGEHTKWLDSKVTDFELEMNVGGSAFLYKIRVEQVADYEKPRIIQESAQCGGRLLFNRDLNGVQLPRAGGGQSGFPLDWRRAALGAIQPASDRPEIRTLQDELASIVVVRPNPVQMESESREEQARPSLDLGNLVSWYRHLAQNQEWSDHLRETLQSVWPDFRYFRLQNTGLQAKALQLRFDSTGSAEAGDVYFGELSDGEKMLVGLYMLRGALATRATRTAIIDEPDNFVGLPELQPWLISLIELLADDVQAIISSHHPEILNAAGEQSAHYLWRDDHTSPTRIGPLRPVEGLTTAETVARGWVNA